MDAGTLQLIKASHVTLAVVSALGFALRGAWIVAGQGQRLQRRWVRIAPHVVDTCLLLAGLTLALSYRLSPLAHPWFAAKLLLLVAYIASGSVAIRRGRRGEPAGIWLAMALACLALIFASAFTHRPLALPVL